MSLTRHLAAAAALTFLAFPALADPAEGLWRTEPDRKNLISHIEVWQCGKSLCGRSVAACDPSGKKVHTPNVGRRLFWDMQPSGGGRYKGGTAYVPLLDVEVGATMFLKGDKLVARGGAGIACGRQTWTGLSSPGRE